MRRVRRPAQHEQLMKRLAGDEGPFTTLAEVLTFTAGLGYAAGRREPLAASGEQIDFDVFQRLGVEGFIDMLAGAVHDDVTILGPAMSDERLTVFEEFANGGLDILQSRLAQSKADLDSLLTIVLDRERDTAADDGAGVDFDAVVDELSR
ncbi:MAG: DNA phosphorothioation-associated protein 4 [Solirubrobacteraceae bacterium]